jgi:hypothetical protein
MNLNPFKLVKKLVYRLVLSELSRTLIQSWTESGSEWTYDTYRLTHKPTKIQLWVGNGAWHFNVIKEGSSTNCEGNVPIGYLERHVLWHEYSIIMKNTKKAKVKKLHNDLLSKLNPSETPLPAETEQVIVKTPKPSRKVTVKV